MAEPTTFKETIDKPGALLAVELLHAYGIRHAVVSPGSRCAPLTVAMHRSGYFDLHVVIDERSAAFVGLGMALATGRTVALVCTSGSAVLNYAPALAEALYRKVPLVAISADRPMEMIDQRDSQTIRQAGALDAVVRRSIDIADVSDPRYLRYANRLMNEVLTAATTPIPGPVHINLQFDAPLTPMANFRVPEAAHKITLAATRHEPEAEIGSLVRPSDKVMIVAGGNNPDERLRRVLERLSETRKAVVIAEAQSNLHGFIQSPELESASPSAPDVLITLGGSIISAKLKSYLRGCRNLHHISLGADDNFNDTFFALETCIDCEPAAFLELLDDSLESNVDFCSSWQSSTRRTPSCDALQNIIDMLHGYDVHFSNGSAARYAQLLHYPASCRVECNRGVSGIEGATSTAIGYAMVSDRPVVLVTGDMSAAYDIAAFSLRGIPDSFRIVVLDNDGGDIFRAVATTRSLPEREEFFATRPNLPLEDLCRAYGFAYFTDADKFCAYQGSPAVLRLAVPQGDAAKIL